MIIFKMSDSILYKKQMGRGEGGEESKIAERQRECVCERERRRIVEKKR
jgi:hypothetical protein